MSQDIESSSGLSTEEIIAILGVLLLAGGFILYYLWPSDSNPVSDFNQASVSQRAATVAAVAAPAVPVTVADNAPASISQTLNLSGRAEPGQRFEVVINGETRGTTTTDSQGNWRYQALASGAGELDVRLEPLSSPAVVAEANVNDEPAVMDTATTTVESLPEPATVVAAEPVAEVAEPVALAAVEPPAPVIEVAEPAVVVAEPVVEATEPTAVVTAIETPAPAEITAAVASAPVRSGTPAQDSSLSVAEPADPSQRVLEVNEPREIVVIEHAAESAGDVVETAETLLVAATPTETVEATLADLHKFSDEEIASIEADQNVLVAPMVEQAPQVIEEPVALAKPQESAEIATGSVAPAVISANLPEPTLLSVDREAAKGELTVSGNAEKPGQTMILLINGILTEALQADEQGRWDYTFRAAPGEYYIRAMNTDASGSRISTDQKPVLYNVSLTNNDDTRLNTLNGQYHAVKRGETLFSIAKANGLGANDLMMINGLGSPEALQAGSTLFIPR